MDTQTRPDPGNGTKPTGSEDLGSSEGRLDFTEPVIRYRDNREAPPASPAAVRAARGSEKNAIAFGEAFGARYANCRLDNFRIENAKQQAVLDDIKKYCDDFPTMARQGRGIILFGPCGTGKDHLLAGLAWEVWLRTGISSTCRTGLDLFSQLRDCVNGSGSEQELFKQLSKPKILILSDPLPPRGALTDWQAAFLLRVIDHRYRQWLPTWTSLNVASGSEADDRMGAQTADRLRDGALCLFCDWPSYRRPSNS